MAQKDNPMTMDEWVAREVANAPDDIGDRMARYWEKKFGHLREAEAPKTALGKVS